VKWLWGGLLTLAAICGIAAIIGVLLPQNHSATRLAHFHQPPQAVWDVIAGPPTWRPNVKSFENLPPRNGHRMWKEIDAHGNAVTYEAIEETPPFRLITQIADPHLPYGGMWVHEISLEPGGCVLQITENGEIYNPIYRFMSRFVFGYSATIDAAIQALKARLGESGS
jgi:hypothetical protein